MNVFSPWIMELRENIRGVTLVVSATPTLVSVMPTTASDPCEPVSQDPEIIVKVLNTLKLGNSVYLLRNKTLSMYT